MLHCPTSPQVQLVLTLRNLGAILFLTDPGACKGLDLSAKPILPLWACNSGLKSLNLQCGRYLASREKISNPALYHFHFKIYKAAQIPKS